MREPLPYREELSQAGGLACSRLVARLLHEIANLCRFSYQQPLFFAQKLTSLAFRGDGNTLLAATDDKTIRVWRRKE
jgi:WD40 repeat protein